MTEKPRAAGPETSGPTPGGSAPAGDTGERVVIRDKRKINVDGSTETGTGQANGSKPVVKDPNPDPEPSAAETEPVIAAGEVDDTGATDAAVAVDDADAPDDGPEVPDSTATSADETGRAESEPITTVIDDAEIAEVLEAEQPSGTEGPVVDAPAEPVSDATGPVDGQPAPLGAELEALRAELDERTRDLQRVTAEYANYRKRVERDRGAAAKETTGKVFTALLPVLDDLDRAREHGDLVGPFGTVAEQLVGTLTKLGLTPFGEKGDPFDPNRHEAVAHLTSAEVTEPTCVDVMRRGYEFGDKVLRAALVAVADPE